MEQFLAVVEAVNSAVNNVVWGLPMLVLLVGTGIYVTVRTRFFQVSHFGHVFKKTVGGIGKNDNVLKNKEKKSISQFQALCTALSATLGTGNISGVAGAIIVGGPGAVFWMWLAAFFGMMTNYAENVLGIYFRRRNKDGEWCGGAMYYLQDGLGSKKGCHTLGRVLAVVFSIFCSLAAFGIGNMCQINNISGNMQSAFHIPTWVTGVVLAAVAALVILGGLKRIAQVTERIVPFMAIIYIVGSLILVFANAQNILPAFGSIFRGAFALDAVAGGVVGVLIKKVITQGFKRGVFSNEAGLGSSVMVHSASNVKEPVKQGMWGIFEVFFDTIVVCTVTALVVLTTGAVDLGTGLMVNPDASKATLVSQAFSTMFGTAGEMFIALAVLLFAFSTVLGWSYYGSKSCEYLVGTKLTNIYKVIFIVAVFFGAVMGENLAWDISDTLNGLMAIPNLIGVLSCSGIVFAITKNYVARRLKKQNVKPLLSYDEQLQQQAEASLSEDD